MYWARWSEGGVRRRVALGTRELAEAEQKFEALVQRAERAPAAGSVADVLARWLAYQSARRKPRSMTTYRTVARRFSGMWGSLQAVARADVERAQESMLLAKLEPRTVNQQITFALAALRWGAERDLCSPPPKWRKLGVNRGSPRKYLSAPELARLFDTLRSPRFRRLEPAVMLAVYSGLRVGEIAALRWENVDLENGWLHVRARRDWQPKSAASVRSVPLPDPLQQFLAERRRADDRSEWVCTRRGGLKWDDRWLGECARSLFQRAGLRDGHHTMHRLRGTFATEVLKTSGDLRSLMAMLGHGSLAVTSVYLAEVDDHKRSAVAGLRF